MDTGNYLSGLLSGSLHAFTGLDHLALLLPFCIGKHWFAWKTGFIWGLGHGIGIMLFGLLSYLIKLVLPFDLTILAKWLDVAVGLSLIAIGLHGIWETLQERKKVRRLWTFWFIFIFIFHRKGTNN